MIVEYYKPYAAHVANVAKRNRIRISRMNQYMADGDYMAAESYKDSHMVRIPEINNEDTYLTALHEIGHCLHLFGNIKNHSWFDNVVDSKNLTEEAAAWSWAFQKSKLTKKANESSFAKMCYGTYVRDCKDSKKAPYKMLEGMRPINKIHQLLTTA